MNEEEKQKIKIGIEKLPEELKETINSFGWEDILNKIGIIYSLDEEEISKLQKEVGLVLTEETPIELLISKIENNIGLSRYESEKIISEIEQKIFDPMITKLGSNIKDSTNFKNVTWDKSINFIMSGGDYSVFLSK
jgi:hypothetical protein